MSRRWLALPAALLIRSWLFTLRARRVGPPFEGPGLVAFWHGDQLPLLGQRPGGRLVAPVSLSVDGRLQARILARLGIGHVSGSSSRGGASALRGLWRALRGGALALMAVDGPRGPRGAVKPGVIYLARRTGLPIWPVGVAVSRGWRLRRAWDRYLLPCPFARAIVRVGAPWHPPPDGPIEDACAELARRIARTNAAARRDLARRRGPEGADTRWER